MIKFDLRIFFRWVETQPPSIDEEFRAAVRSGEDAALEALLKKGIDPNLPGLCLRPWRMAPMTWIRGYSKHGLVYPTH